MARYKMTVDLPHLPKGEAVDVPPAGLVENGGSVVFEASDELMEGFNFADAYGVTVKATKEPLTKTPEEEETPPEPEEEGGEG